MRFDDVVQALEVLDVDGRDHVDAGREQLLDVLPALLVRLPGTFVWASSSTSTTCGRRTRIASTSISSSTAPPVLDLLAGHDFEVADLLRVVRPPVRLDEADDDVGAPLRPPPALVEHGEGLADAGDGAEVDAQACHAPIDEPSLAGCQPVSEARRGRG